MHKKFFHNDIETKWQEEWKKNGIYNLGPRDIAKEKEYVLVEWPYPSGNLHIGHWFAFAVVDIYVRTRRMQGKQVLFPIGFDAFGLPAENAAIKHNLNPKEWTDSNIAFMKTQLESMGNAFSWDITTSSTDAEYYKWTQWMFTQFFENDIAYRGVGMVNWCPGCNTVIANEQVQSDNTCERSGDVIEKREMPQWMLRITQFADRLIDDLDTLDWPEHIKEAQRQWIGRSKGAELPFTLSAGESIDVFTTRPDTLFGATYLVLAPEHDAILKNKEHITNWDAVAKYVDVSSKKNEIERIKTEKEKTGVKLEGITAINPATQESIPVYIADYVLKGYGTGAIMAVPAHDERDFAFATKFNLPITQVVVPCAIDANNPPQNDLIEVKRDTVIVHLHDKSTGKYALLKWHGSLEGIVTAVMGGIEDGQSPESAALAEIAEETGFADAVIVKRSGSITAARYHASHKNQNRCAHSHALIAEIESAETQRTIAPDEKAKHTLIWVPESEVVNTLTPEHQKLVWNLLQKDLPLTGNGYLINSGEFNEINSEDAKEAIVQKVGGKMTNTYRLRDWSIGRQRYWGVPIPIVYDPEGKPHSIPKEYLPWHLPTDVDFKPTGVPPLAKSAELKERVEKIFGKGWTPEVETMDTFVDSSWYFLRYIDAHNSQEFSSLDAQKTWMPVNTYFGGAEHTTMHLLYSRFWQKALFDLNLVLTSEPYIKRMNRGLVLGPDGNKMSKSKGNVIDPDAIVKQLGADTVKMYLAFMGPYGESTNYPWDLGGVVGLRRFLERVYGLHDHISKTQNIDTTKLLHKSIVKVTSDINVYKFNTAISSLMIFINHVEKTSITEEEYLIFLRLLAPFAPHLAEELWHAAEAKGSIHESNWPIPNQEMLTDDTSTISVQFDGKMRGLVSVPRMATEAEVLDAVRSDADLGQRMTSTPKRVIYIKNKIINIIL